VASKAAEQEEVKIDESKLRRVSVSLNNLLFTSNHTGTFDTNAGVRQLLVAMKNKYRLFLITQVDKDGSAQHEQVKSEMGALIA